MHYPKISAIVPVYNTEKYLHRCIDSILSQTFNDFELLLIDDGSKDESGKICEEYAQKDARVRVLHKENGGVSSARNMGLDNARGEWISFIDADDWIHLDTYNILVEKADTGLFDFIIFAFKSIFAESEKQVKIPDYKKDSKRLFIREYLLSGWTVVWNLLIRTEFINKNNIRFQEGINIGEDFQFLFRALLITDSIGTVNRPLYYYNRINESSALHNLSFNQYDDIIRAIIDIICFFKERGIYDDYRDILSWKVLKGKQDYVLDPAFHKKFLEIYPESHRYILSCPIIGKKIKLMMWCLTHHMGFITNLINKLRFLMRR